MAHTARSRGMNRDVMSTAIRSLSALARLLVRASRPRVNRHNFVMMTL
jgi:hypothetical protein